MDGIFKSYKYFNQHQTKPPSESYNVDQEGKFQVY